MWTRQATTVCRATPEAVFALWAVDRWTAWDPEVEWARLDGPFEAGTRGELKPRGGPRTRFTLLEVDQARGFADRSHLPLTSLDFRHLVEPLGDGTVRITHTVTFSGPLAFLFSRLLGPKLERGLPGAVAALGRLAEAAGAARAG